MSLKCCPSFTDSFVVCLFFSSRELDFICIAMTPKCSVRHYKRQISCFPEAKVLMRHSTPFSVTSLANPEWALVDELGLSPSWWQRRPLPLQCQPQGVGVTQSGSFHPDASVGKDTFHLCEAKKMRERCGSSTASSALCWLISNQFKKRTSPCLFFFLVTIMD